MSTSIFNMPSSTTSISPKVNFTHIELSPNYLDPSQLPTKGVPFRQIGDIPFAKDVKICMPVWVRESLYSDSTKSIVPQDGGGMFPGLQYATVTMTLKDILDNEDLRRGNYLFLSALSSPSSNSTTISMDCGKLIIDMPLHVYQRAGLTFPVSKIPSGGRKHDPRSARHRIEMDLRQPSMVKGKKGFDRLMYAAKNVEGLNESRTWMFSDLSDISETNSSTSKKRKRDAEDNPAKASDGSDSQSVMNQNIESTDGHPLSKFKPSITATGNASTTSPEVMIPSFLSNSKFFSTLPLQAGNQQAKKADIPKILEEDIYDIIEYLSLVFLQSPRISKTEYRKIDPYLCQYTLPDVTSPSEHTGNNMETSGSTKDETDPAIVEDLSMIPYSGFVPSAFVIQLFVDIIRRSRSTKTPLTTDNAWVAINIVAHKTEVTGSPEGLVILLHAGEDTKGPTTSAVSGDTTMTEEQQDLQNVEDIEPSSKSHRGFRFATCFEFVDSMTG